MSHAQDAHATLPGPAPTRRSVQRHRRVAPQLSLPDGGETFPAPLLAGLNPGYSWTPLSGLLEEQTKLEETETEDEELPMPLWSLYFDEAQRHDDGLFKHMQEDTSNILVFSGLFSAVLATFLVDSIELLRSATGASDSDPAQTPSHLSIFRVNALWLVSLVLSLCYALGATLMQHWTRRYRRVIEHIRQRGFTPVEGRMHAYARAGAEYFKLESTVDGLQILLHISFALFFAGLAEFLFPIDGALGWIFLGPVCFGGLIYLGFTAIPIISPSAPYSTPLSTIWIFAMRRRREQGVGLLIPLLMLLKHFVMAVPRLLYGIVQFVDGPNRGLLIEPGFMLEFYTFLGLRDAAHPDGFPLDSRVEEILVATKCDLSLDATAMGWTLARIMHRNEDLEKFMDALALAQPCERAKRTATTVLVTRGFHQRLTRVFEMPRFKGILGHAKGQVSLVLSCLQALRHVVNLEPDMGSCWRTFQAVLEPMRKLERGGNKTISFDAMYTAAILSLYLLKEVEKTDEPAFTDSLLSFISRHLQDADRPAGRTDQLARLQSTGRMDIVANFVDNLLTCDSDTLEPNINLVLAFLQDLNLEPPAADEHRKWIRDEMRRVCQSLIKKGWPDSKELHTLYTTEEDLPNLPDTIASNPLSKLYEALRAIDIPLSAPPGDQTAGQSGQVPSAPPPGQGPATYPPSSSARQTASTRRPSANDGYTSLPGHDSEDIEAQLGRA